MESSISLQNNENSFYTSKVVKMKQLSFDRGKANLDFDMLELNFTQKFIEILCSVAYFWICLQNMRNTHYTSH